MAIFEVFHFLPDVTKSADSVLMFLQMLIIGKIIFLSGGLLFIHPQHGSITLSKDHISSIKFYDPVIFTVHMCTYKVLFCTFSVSLL